MKRGDSDASGASATAASTSAKSKPLKRHLTIEYEPKNRAKEPPANWHATWLELEAMRAKHPAPVDSMGCDSFYDPKEIQKEMPTISTADAERTARYRVLVSLMLSSQTKDTENAKAMRRLIDSGKLTVDGIIAIDDDELNTMIHNVGFHNKKVVYLKKTAQILKDKHAGDVPNTLTDIVALPGVGYKMAHLLMQAAWGITLGISVDTHVHRISARLGWTKNAKSPGDTADQLESWLPKEHWRRINHSLVGHGQTICTPLAPKCGECSLFEKKLCKRVGLGSAGVKRKPKEDEEDQS